MQTWQKAILISIPATLIGLALVAWRLGFAAPPSTHAVFWSASWGIAFMLVLLGVLAAVASSGNEFLIWFVLGSLGAASGWVIGILVSPYSTAEASRFSEIRTTLLGLISGAAATQLGALWQKLVDGPSPRIFQKVYAIPVILFASTCLISMAVQYNIREYGGATVVIGGVELSALPTDGTSHLHVWNGRPLVLSGLTSYEEDPTVEWSVEVGESDLAKKVHIDARSGTLSSDPELTANDRKGDKTVIITAMSHWNHTWRAELPLQVGARPVAAPKDVAESKTGERPAVKSESNS
jgi:hypothetical protein